MQLPAYVLVPLCLLGQAFELTRAASILFTNAAIVTFNTSTSNTQLLHNSSILVEGDRISQIYNGTAPKSCPNGTEVVDATGKIISPGFINTHHHLWQTAFKTIASNTTLAEYFQRYGEFSPTVDNWTPEDKYLSQLTGALELLNAGTTTVLDHAHGDSSNEAADAIFNATLDSGLRTYHAFTIHQLPNNYTTQEQIKKLVELARDPRLTNSALVSLGLSYDFFDTSSTDMINRLWDIVQNQNLTVVTSHYLGGPWLVSNSPTLLQSLGWLNSTLPVIFAHASFITASDFHSLRETNQYISTTPESELHYGHGHPFAELIQDQASLGVDTHFTFSPYMAWQARLWLQDLRIERYEDVIIDHKKIPVDNPMSTEQAFNLITRAGALALRRPDLGIIAAGAKADIVILDGESPNMLGWTDAVAAIILHSHVGDVEHVLVGGEWRKRDGKMVYPGYTEVKRRFLQSARRIQNIWKQKDWPSLDEGLYMNTTKWGHTEVIDTMAGNGTGY